MNEITNGDEKRRGKTRTQKTTQLEEKRDNFRRKKYCASYVFRSGKKSSARAMLRQYFDKSAHFEISYGR